MKRLSIRVHGRVQGVFFRLAAKEKALKSGLSGFARNEPDGSVYIEAEGAAAAVDEFAAWCRKGTEISRVFRAEAAEIPVQGGGGFVIY